MKRRWVQGMLLAGMLILTGCGAKNSSPVENGKDYTWNDITVMLPEDWADRCTIKEDENGFTIYQTASYEKMEGLGYLCSFEKSDAWMNYGAGENLIAYTEDGTLYFVEKVAFQEPYRMLRFADRTALSDYLMGKYDTSWGQDMASPFIMENDKLMDGWRPNPDSGSSALG